MSLGGQETIVGRGDDGGNRPDNVEGNETKGERGEWNKPVDDVG